VRERRWVAWGNEQSVHVRLDEIWNSTDLGCHDRQRSVHVLHHRKRTALEIRAANGNIKSAQDVGDV